jgi:hypothetical protein|tara:strand:+ start:97 stop:522 length:426 start_codon:yes stop_codon:yes gene_type:complete
MRYTLENIREEFKKDNPIIYRYNFNATKWNTFELMRDISFLLDDGVEIEIKKGFTWDLSSVPNFLWWLLKPFGQYDAAYLLHDKIYKLKGLNIYSRKQCDQLMRDFALALVDTKKLSLRRLDVWTRYYAVRLFGWIVWNKK